MSALLVRHRQVDEMLKAEQSRQFMTEQEGWQELAAILGSAPGVGVVTTATFLAELPELGKMDRKKIAALVGIAPMNFDSGRKRGYPKTNGGRGDVRSVLYMSTLVASRCNPLIQKEYTHLLARGKLKKVALIACMRKFLTILNAMLRDKQPFRSAAIA